jgi:hypothetical protein
MKELQQEDAGGDDEHREVVTLVPTPKAAHTTAQEGHLRTLAR